MRSQFNTMSTKKESDDIADVIKNKVQELLKDLTVKELVTKLTLFGVRVDEPRISRLINGSAPIKREKIQKQWLDVLDQLIDNISFRELYFKELYDLKDKVGSLNIIKYFSKRYNLHENDVTQYIYAMPNSIFSIINDKSNKNEPSKIFEYSSDGLRDCNTSNFFQDYHKDPVKIETLKTAVLSHSLSPYSESLALLCELGRYKRIVSAFDMDPYIILTTVNSIKYNKAIELANSKIKLTENLKKCFEFREKLYSRLSLNFDIREISDIFPKNKKWKNINEESEYYTEYSYALMEHIEDIVRDIEEPYFNLLKTIDNLKNKLTEKKYLLLPTTDSMRNIYIISAIKKYFGRLDQDTIIYSLMQRYSLHDEKYHGALKIGDKSEQRLDFAFAKMDTYDLGTHKMYGLYFSNYFFKNEHISHTSSSGFLKETETLDDACEKTILLFDYSNDERKSKVKKLINNIELVQLATQLSDLFSFCYYFFCENNFHYKNDFWNGCRNIFEEFEFLEIYESIKSHDEKLMCDFQNAMFSIWYDKIKPPYFYYPYIVSLSLSINMNSIKEKNYRTFAYKFIIYTIEQVCTALNFEEW